jgi:hypothetical protein
VCRVNGCSTTRDEEENPYGFREYEPIWSYIHSPNNPTNRYTAMMMMTWIEPVWIRNDPIIPMGSNIGIDRNTFPLLSLSLPSILEPWIYCETAVLEYRPCPKTNSTSGDI